MGRRPLSVALTGPCAAALLGLDGFEGIEWPTLWCAPPTAGARHGVVRTRQWREPVLIGDVLVAPPQLMVRHLGLLDDHCYRPSDGITKRDRIELAVEHLLRGGQIELSDLCASGAKGMAELLEVRRLRGHEPPTESYAETRAVQLFRVADWVPWRQVRVFAGGRIMQRVDFVLPSRRGPRPEVLLPHHGLLVEIDGRGPHEREFERDHRRQTNYDALGFRWTSFSATQIEREPLKVLEAIRALLALA
jgi:hypothetical protein